jgi:3-hydroxyacyl-CoA dehydrogenase
VDIVIEAVPEKMAIKKRVFAELDEVCPETPSSPPTPRRCPSRRWARRPERPAKVIGMHFFNPAHVMKLVEVIPGLDTSQETVDDVVSLPRACARSPSSCRNAPASWSTACSCPI